MLYNPVGIIELSVTFQDYNSINDTINYEEPTRTYFLSAHNGLSIMPKEGTKLTLQPVERNVILINHRHRDG